MSVMTRSGATGAGSLGVAGYAIGLPVGGAVTFGLFLFMSSLVGSDKLRLRDVEDIRIVDFINTPEDIEVDRIERQPEPPPEVEAPPPDLELDLSANIDPNAAGLAFDTAQVDSSLDIAVGSVGAPTDGEYLPIVKVEPEYPRRAAERGVEGEVLLEFTVTELGTVEDIEVISAEPKGYFERAAIRAAEKFKYKPKVVNGNPIAVTGVQHILTFKLAEGNGRRR